MCILYAYIISIQRYITIFYLQLYINVYAHMHICIYIHYVCIVTLYTYIYMYSYPLYIHISMYSYPLYIYSYMYVCISYLQQAGQCLWLGELSEGCQRGLYPRSSPLSPSFPAGTIKHARTKICPVSKSVTPHPVCAGLASPVLIDQESIKPDSCISIRLSGQDGHTGRALRNNPVVSFRACGSMWAVCTGVACQGGCTAGSFFLPSGLPCHRCLGSEAPEPTGRPREPRSVGSAPLPEP